MSTKITGVMMTLSALGFQAVGDWGSFYELLEKGGLVAILGFFCYLFYRMGEEKTSHYEKKLQEAQEEIKRLNELHREEIKTLLVETAGHKIDEIQQDIKDLKQDQKD